MPEHSLTSMPPGFDREVMTQDVKTEPKMALFEAR